MMKGTTTPVMMMRMTKVLVITTMAEVHGTKKPLMMMFNMTNTAIRERLVMMMPMI